MGRACEVLAVHLSTALCKAHCRRSHTAVYMQPLLHRGNSQHTGHLAYIIHDRDAPEGHTKGVQHRRVCGIERDKLAAPGGAGSGATQRPTWACTLHQLQRYSKHEPRAAVLLEHAMIWCV